MGLGFLMYLNLEGMNNSLLWVFEKFWAIILPKNYGEGFRVKALGGTLVLSYGGAALLKQHASWCFQPPLAQVRGASWI